MHLIGVSLAWRETSWMTTSYWANTIGQLAFQWRGENGLDGLVWLLDGPIQVLINPAD